ncbi:hypothetical protein VTI74DRAFT_5827 [Chaetomium olivicolor]
MKSPLDLASRCLSDIEDRWIPYSALWWRLWTPRIPRGDRYQAGAFAGYGDPNEDNDDPDNPITPRDLPPHDIRRILSVPFLRHIYKKTPYIDVVPVTRPWTEMPLDQQLQRVQFIIDSTLDAYRAGKALYPRDVIVQIESQLAAAAAKLARRRKTHVPDTRGALSSLSRLYHHHLRHTLFSHCEAPQTAFLRYPAFDGVTQHVATWAPGAALILSDGETVYRPGQSQVEFRTIQELTQPDPENDEAAFVVDSWMPSVGYAPVVVRLRGQYEGDLPTYSGEEEGAQVTEGELERALEEEWVRVRKSAEWKVLEGKVQDDGVQGEGVRRVLSGVEKVVFFYAEGLTEGSVFAKRAMFLFAVATCLREVVHRLYPPGNRPEIPIYMPTYDINRRWSTAEEVFLHKHGVRLVESNGELFLKVDQRTAVVSYRNWNPVKQVVADIAKPAVLICRPVNDDPDQDFRWKEEEREGEEPMAVPQVRSRLVDRSIVLTDPDSPRVRKLVREYDRLELPELPGRTVEEGEEDEELCVYVRKADASTKVEYW